jgi:hypothetical protein
MNTSYIAGYGRETEVDKNLYPGHAYFLDKDFNILGMKHYRQRNGLENLSSRPFGTSRRLRYLGGNWEMGERMRKPTPRFATAVDRL